MSTQALSAPISSLSQTEAARWNAVAPEQLTGAHLYQNIAKSGYLYHSHSGGMASQFHVDEMTYPYYRLNLDFANGF